MLDRWVHCDAGRVWNHARRFRGGDERDRGAVEGRVGQSLEGEERADADVQQDDASKYQPVCERRFALPQSREDEARKRIPVSVSVTVSIPVAIPIPITVSITIPIPVVLSDTERSRLVGRFFRRRGLRASLFPCLFLSRLQQTPQVDTPLQKS